MKITVVASGHVAIAYQSITQNNFISFDQNWNAQEGELITHTYNGVLGFLTPKATPPAPSFEIKTKFKWALYANKIRRRNKYGR